MKQRLNYCILLSLLLPHLLAATVEDYAGIFSLGEQERISNRVSAVWQARQWQVLVVTQSSAQPQITQNLAAYLASRSAQVVLVLPVFYAGHEPGYYVSPDLVSVLPSTALQQLVQQHILPDYARSRFGEAARKGVAALLTAGARLQQVTFPGSIPIAEEPLPQWEHERQAQHLPQGAVASPLGGWLHPAPVIRWTGPPPASPLTIVMRHLGNQYQAPAIYANGEIRLAVDTALRLPTGNSVRYQAALPLTWALAWGGQEYPLDTSRHEVFVTLQQPAGNTLDGNLRKEHFYYACTQAQGSRTVASTLDRLWQPFAELYVPIRLFNPQRESAPLTYYKNPDVIAQTDEFLFDTAIAPQLYLDGQCGAFATTFINILWAAGIDSDRKSISPIEGRLMLIQQWAFTDTPSFPGAIYPYVNIPDARVTYVPLGTTLEGVVKMDTVVDMRLPGHRYAWLETPDVADMPGLPGQGPVLNPYSDFSEHQLVAVGAKLFDPSYGRVFPDLPAWEDNSLAGVGVFNRIQDPITGQEYYYLFVQKSKNGIPDTK
ncbi:MAG: TPM domain-containing protein [Lewinellaceae bacterium]|nr:TPM domain-containing protein [Lewinellaceae bacterium]